MAFTASMDFVPWKAKEPSVITPQVLSSCTPFMKERNAPHDDTRHGLSCTSTNRPGSCVWWMKSLQRF
jgi:hypothetical protein